MKFSLCMIVKNEEVVLKDCLDSLRDLMDEIIIVDTGSTDRTKEIAAQYTDKIYDFEWCNDFAAARNFAFSKATGDYIYSADADEYIDEQNRVRFKALKQVLVPEVEIVLSDRLLNMYLRELYKAGDEETLLHAREFLEKMLEDAASKKKELLTRQIIAVLLKIYRISDDATAMLKIGLREEITVPSAEVCMEFGYFFLKKEDYPQAAHWFYIAAFESESEIDIASSGTSPLMALALSYRRYAKSPRIKALPQEEYEMEKLRLTRKAAEYEQMARDWKPAENGF